MKEFEYEIKDELGIHARPAGLLVKLVKQYSSQITLTKGDTSAAAKGIMGIMSLGVEKGDLVKVTADGGDEDAAIAALKEFFESNL